MLLTEHTQGEPCGQEPRGFFTFTVDNGGVRV